MEPRGTNLKDVTNNASTQSAGTGPALSEKEATYKTEWLGDVERLFRWSGLRGSTFEEITNQYDQCPYLPWLNVTTHLGVFTIGWRYRVMVLDWQRTSIRAVAKELFKDENVTMEGPMIHCWGYGKALDYLRALVKRSEKR